MAIAAKQKLADYKAFFKLWESRVRSDGHGPEVDTQHEIIVLKRLNFDEAYKDLKVKLESELAGRVTYLQYENLLVVIPDHVIIDMSNCALSEDILFTLDE